jgi:Tfp pilus assembly PilM family ATPase
MISFIAGEVYQEQEAKNEIILMAAPRDLVNQFLNAAARAKLNVRGMLTEPNAVVDCFAHIYRRKSDLDATSLFIDLGSTGARAFVARAGQTLFARKIPIGGEHLTRAVAASTGMNVEEARLLRLRLSNIDTVNQPKANEELEVEEENREGFALLGAALSAAAKENEQKPSSATMVAEPVAAKASSKTDDAKVAAHRVEIACHELLNKLVAELDLCRRYYEATFPNRPVDRLIFVGGEAKNRALCQHIARELGIAAQVGDPLVRMGRISDVGIESGIDRRQPQPNWAVAIGLSLGPRGGGDGDGN